jgi:hypothetical protein
LIARTLGNPFGQICPNGRITAERGRGVGPAAPAEALEDDASMVRAKASDDQAE